MDRKLLNVVLLGFAFQLIFTAFQSCGMIQETVLHSAKFGHAGYYSLAAIYASFTLCNFLAPPIVSCLGPKRAMILGGVTYGIFLGAFLWLHDWLLYSTSILLGLGAAVIWTGQGKYLILNSDTPESMARNSGLVWAMFQSSLLFGSVFLFLEFRDKPEIDSPTRFVVYVCFTSLCAAGIVVMIFFGAVKPSTASDTQPIIISGESEEDIIEQPQVVEASSEAVRPSFKEDFLATFRLLKSLEMQLLAVTFLYTGFELAFWSGVYGTSLANTKQFDADRNSLLGLNGMFLGFGEILGGLLFGLLGKRTVKYSRNPIVLLGLVSHILGFFIIFLNIPDGAPLGETTDAAYITSLQSLAMVCSFLLGFGDSCYNTQIYSILGSIFPDAQSAPAFALFRFFQSASAAAGFFYSSVLVLRWQLLILVVCSFLGTITFLKVENNLVAQRLTADTKSS